MARAARRFAVVTAVAALAPTALPSFGLWSSGGTGRGSVVARNMPTGSAPSGSVANRTVSLSWTASTIDGTTAVTGYTVKRYNAANVLQAIGSGTCNATVSGTSCDETNVATGTWNYTVTPLYSNWTGTESPHSTGIAVSGGSLTLTSPTQLDSASLPSSLSGTISGFRAGETLTFHLDSAGGATLAGTVDGTSTPTAIPNGGSGAVTITIPSGTTNGSHSVYAVATESDDRGSAAFTVQTGGVPAPVVTAGILASYPQHGKGKLRPGGQYAVLANVSGSVNAGGVTANVANVTTGATSVAVPTCSGVCTIQGSPYAYRSSEQTANAGLTEAMNPISFTVTAVGPGGTTTATFSARVDATRPTTAGTLRLVNGPTSANCVDTDKKNNAACNNLAQIDPGDFIELQFADLPSDPDPDIAVNSICTNWNNNASNQSATARVTVTNGDNNTHDFVTASSASCGTLNFGSIDMGAHGYLQTATVYWDSSQISWDVATNTLRIVFGTPCAPSATCGTPQDKGTPVTTAVYTPGAAITDIAGNTISGTESSVQRKHY